MERRILWSIEMLKRQITRQQLATELGISYPHLCNLLAGRKNTRRLVDYIETRLGFRTKPEQKK